MDLIKKLNSEQKQQSKQLDKLYREKAKFEFLSLLLLFPLLIIPFLLFYTLLGKLGLMKQLSFSDNSAFLTTVIYLLTLLLVSEFSWRKLKDGFDQKILFLAQKIRSMLNPFEDTALISYRFSEIFQSLANSKTYYSVGDAFTSDMTRNFHISFIGMNRHRRITYNCTNSFFIGISGVDDIRNKLISLHVPSIVISLEVCSNLNSIYSFVSEKGDLFFGDFKIGEKIFYKLAEAFSAAFYGEFDKFIVFLQETVDAIKQYKETNAPLIGVPLIFVSVCRTIFKILKKILPVLIIFVLIIVASIIAIVFLPKVILTKFPILKNYGINESNLQLIISLAATFYDLFLGKFILRK